MWNRFTSYRERARLILASGYLSGEKRSKYEQTISDAETVLGMIRERRPDIDELVQEHRENQEVARMEVLIELNRLG